MAQIFVFRLRENSTRLRKQSHQKSSLCFSLGTYVALQHNQIKCDSLENEFCCSGKMGKAVLPLWVKDVLWVLGPASVLTENGQMVFLWSSCAVGEMVHLEWRRGKTAFISLHAQSVPHLQKWPTVAFPLSGSFLWLCWRFLLTSEVKECFCGCEQPQHLGSLLSCNLEILSITIQGMIWWL